MVHKRTDIFPLRLKLLMLKLTETLSPREALVAAALKLKLSLTKEQITNAYSLKWKFRKEIDQRAIYGDTEVLKIAKQLHLTLPTESGVFRNW